VKKDGEAAFLIGFDRHIPCSTECMDL